MKKPAQAFYADWESDMHTVKRLEGLLLQPEIVELLSAGEIYAIRRAIRLIRRNGKQ